MNKSEMIARLAEVQEIPSYTAHKIVDIIFGGMAEELIGGGRVEIRGLGVFEIRQYEGHSGRNPKTSEIIKVAPKKLPFFKVGKELKQRVAAG